MGKKIICLCEDLTEDDISAAIDLGFKDLESLKRFTGAFTGPCQGKVCAMNVIKILAEKTSRRIEDVGITTLRPPVKPIPLELLVAVDEQGTGF